MNPNEPHSHIPSMPRLAVCQVCGRGPGDPLHLLTLPGMESTDTDREAERGVAAAAQITETMHSPLGDVSRKTRAIENDSPLFYGVINPTLF